MSTRQFRVAFIAGLLPCALVAQQPSLASAAAPEIVASGVGTITLVPDGALVTIAVVTRGGSASEAGRTNTSQMQSVLATLRRLGQPDSTLGSAGFLVYLDRDPARPRPTEISYVARNAIRVRIADLNGMGRLIDSALAAGATEVANVTFTSTREAAARRDAIGIAVDAARADAEASARAAGGRLGTVIEVDLARDLSFAATRMAYGSPSPASYTPLLPRDVSVAVVARVRYGYLPR
jgi:uncharacterized protein